MSNLRSALDDEANVDLASLTGPSWPIGSGSSTRLVVGSTRSGCATLGYVRTLRGVGARRSDVGGRMGRSGDTPGPFPRALRRCGSARRLERLPRVAAALADGAISVEHALGARRCRRRARVRRCRGRARGARLFASSGRDPPRRRALASGRRSGTGERGPRAEATAHLIPARRHARRSTVSSTGKAAPSSRKRSTTSCTDRATVPVNRYGRSRSNGSMHSSTCAIATSAARWVPRTDGPR